MHTGTRMFMEETKQKYPEFFKDAKILELGSLDVNGTIRDDFFNCEVIGIDKLEGPGVDIQQLAHETKFEKEEFDAIFSISMLEHDEHWKKSIKHNLQWLKPGGLIVFAWGAEGNDEHCKELMTWALVPHKKVVDYMRKLGLEILDEFFEHERYGGPNIGCYDVIARKS